MQNRLRHSGLGLGSAITMAGGQSWSSYWTTQDEVLFFGEISKITDGKLYNQKKDATDYLTVAGTASSYTFQCPNTAPYIAADTDYIWFKTNTVQRTTTEAELIGYDLQKTPVKYLDTTPNTLQAIMILSSAVTGDKLDRLFSDMHLSIFWNGTANDNGYLKSNRAGQQLWTPESVYDAATVAFLARIGTAMSESQETALDNLIKSAKEHNWWTPFKVIRLYHLHTEADSLLNIKGNTNAASKISTPVFTAYSGWVSDGAAKGIDENYTPSTEGDMTQDDGSFIEYISNFPGSETNKFSGGDDGTRFITLGNTTAAGALGRMNETSASSTAMAGMTSGLLGIIRSGATTKMLLNNANKVDDTDASNGLPSRSLSTGCYNNNGSYLYGSSVRIFKARLIGKAISQATFNHIKTDLETFFTAFTA